jgi:hypothetical protein
MDQKIVNKIGWAASALSTIMWFSFIDQIRLNLSGQKGSLITPIVVIINCTLWSLFGFGKKNWQIFACNLPGIIIGAITAVTAL